MFFSRRRSEPRSGGVSRLAGLALLALGVSAAPALATPQGLLETLRKHALLASTITPNGDLNPYAVVIAPADAGPIHAGDVLVDNFNNISNLQGTGTTIVDFRPSTGKTFLIANLPRALPGCPGGVGLTAAMTMLKSGWIIVGSAPSKDGTTGTRGDGCLIVLSPEGEVGAVWAGEHIIDPWGNMAVKDEGIQAVLFVSMAGEGLQSPRVVDPATKLPVVLKKASVLRLRLKIPPGEKPQILERLVVGDGFSQRADLDNFLLGPTGEALDPDGDLYVTDGLDNLIARIPNALTRTDSAGTGEVVSQGGLLSWPLAMVMAPNGHLIAANGKDGRVVEVDPLTKRQVYAQWFDNDQAQSPPGNGDLFGLALAGDGRAIYYVEDDVNTLMRASP